MTKETILEEMERCLIPLSLMANREHQEFIKSALIGNLSKLADNLVKESDSLPCVSQQRKPTTDDVELWNAPDSCKTNGVMHTRDWIDDECIDLHENILLFIDSYYV